VIALVVWSLVGIWVDGPLDWQHAGSSTACAPDPLDAPGDVTLTLGLGSSLPDRPLGVRLHGAHGIVLVEAKVGVVSAGADGRYVLPPLSAGWPALAGGTVAPESLVPAVGASVDGTLDQALVLHLHVSDPTVESGFQDVGIVYRSGLIRHEKRFEYTQRLVPGPVCQMG
jgi:hypothetical protein